MDKRENVQIHLGTLTGLGMWSHRDKLNITRITWSCVIIRASRQLPTSIFLSADEPCAFIHPIFTWTDWYYMQCSTAIIMWLLLFFLLFDISNYIHDSPAQSSRCASQYIYVNSSYVPSHPNKNTTLPFSRVACTCWHHHNMQLRTHIRGGNDIKKKGGGTNKNVKTDDRKKLEGRRIIARVKSRNEYKE